MSLWGVNDESQPSAQMSLGDLCKDNKPGSEGSSPRCECVGRELGGTFSTAASSAASGLGFTDEDCRAGACVPQAASAQPSSLSVQTPQE